MYVDFQTLPATAKIWVYLSNKEFSIDQLKDLNEKLIKFCSRWTKHGDELKSSFLIKHNRFIILAVDESYQEISGCAINKSIKLMKDLEDEFQLELMNRLNTAFILENEVSVVDLATFKEFASLQKINSDTLVFNNLVDTKELFEKNWEIPASQSWHARFLN